jgi:hypothetical protein
LSRYAVFTTKTRTEADVWRASLRRCASPVRRRRVPCPPLIHLGLSTLVTLSLLPWLAFSWQRRRECRALERPPPGRRSAKAREGSPGPNIRNHHAGPGPAYKGRGSGETASRACGQATSTREEWAASPRGAA